MSRLAILAALFAVACAPECKRGHWETVHVAEHYELDVSMWMLTKIPMQRFVAAYDTDVFTCDEWTR